MLNGVLIELAGFLRRALMVSNWLNCNSAAQSASQIPRILKMCVVSFRSSFSEGFNQKLIEIKLS